MVIIFPSAGKSRPPFSHVSQPKREIAPRQRPNLAQLAADSSQLPQFVREDRVAMRCLGLLGPLDWDNFPERDPDRPWPGPSPHPRAAYVAAFLLKINEGKRYMPDLREFLLDHPALIWLLGFKLTPSDSHPHGFDPDLSLPTARHFGRVLREMDQAPLQFLLDSTVTLIQAELPANLPFGDTIAGDTTHIVAWVKENNPKAYVKESDRLDKHRQPAGDPDCKLGCKRKSNQHKKRKTVGDDDNQSQVKKQATQFSSDQYFWGYNSGVIATKLPGYGEFVLAELTLTFDKNDVWFFFPLMEQVERRLGRKPRFAAFDAGFEAFYVFEYFHQAGGMAALPLSERGGFSREFDENGLPLCPTGLPMPLKATYISRAKQVIPHERGRYGCPLRFPEQIADACPIDHANWPKDGCTVTMPTCTGARLRYQIDRKSDQYKAIYKQRTATERINSLSKEFDLERPRLRRGTAIANRNTLIYILINLKGLHRLRERAAKGRLPHQQPPPDT